MRGPGEVHPDMDHTTMRVRPPTDLSHLRMNRYVSAENRFSTIQRKAGDVARLHERGMARRAPLEDKPRCRPSHRRSALRSHMGRFLRSVVTIALGPTISGDVQRVGPMAFSSRTDRSLVLAVVRVARSYADCRRLKGDIT